MTAEHKFVQDVMICLYNDTNVGFIEQDANERLKLTRPSVVVMNRYSFDNFRSPTSHRAYLNKPAWEKLTEIYSKRFDPGMELLESHVKTQIQAMIDKRTNSWPESSQPTIDFYPPLPESSTELYRNYKIDFSYIKFPPIEETFQLVVKLFPSSD